MHFEDRINEVTEKLHNLFSQDTVGSIAKETGFIQRSTAKLNPLNFLVLMSVHVVMNAFHSLEAMTDILAQMPGGVKITAQALCSRLNRLVTVGFLWKCYALLLEKSTVKVVDTLRLNGSLRSFGQVFIEDSTTCQLNEQLAASYKGSGGNASKSAYKIHLIFETIRGDIANLKITEATVPDQTMSEHIVDIIDEGDLVIRDLGYFVLASFKKISDKGAFFLSRLKLNVKIYTTDGREIENLPEYIETYFSREAVIEMNVLIGAKEKLSTRLIIYRTPEAILKQRNRNQNKNAKKKGRTVSKKSKQWNRFTFFITNVPKEIWQAEIVGNVYRLRWEIELIFKNWKSNLKIDLLKGKSKERIECFIISKLMSIVTMTLYFSILKIYVYSEFERELSMHKFIRWFLRNERLLFIAKPKLFERELMQVLDESILNLCKQKRKRLSTLEQIENSIGFPKSHTQNTQKKEVKMIA